MSQLDPSTTKTQALVLEFSYPVPRVNLKHHKRPSEIFKNHRKTFRKETVTTLTLDKLNVPQGHSKIIERLVGTNETAITYFENPTWG